ncbi:MAG: hypothetical protein AAF764_00060 [Pseudomonadota bacterium]
MPAQDKNLATYLVDALPKTEVNLDIEGKLEPEMILALVKNSIVASFLSDSEKQAHLNKLDEVARWT